MPPRKNKRSKTAVAASGADASSKVNAKTIKHWKTVRGKRGGLKNFMEMPLDIIQEICLLLYPQDLLSLSRTTKALHDFLMRKACTSIWKDSLSRIVDLPKRPSRFIEPAWVSLLFSPTCTDILSDRQWKNFKAIQGVLLQVTVTGYKTPCYLASEVLETIKAYLRLPRKAECEAFINKRAKLADKRKKLAANCERWVAEEEHRGYEEARNAQRERINDVCARLCALGWEPEVEYLRKHNFDPFADIRAIWVMKKLTDQGNMRAEVIARMDDVRAQRLEYEYNVMMAERWEALEHASSKLLKMVFRKHPELDICGLNTSDLALQDEFRALMCAPADVHVDTSAFLALNDHIEEIVERWRVRVYQVIREKVDKAGFVHPAGGDPLELATAVFSGPGKYVQHFEFLPFLLKHLRPSVNVPTMSKYELWAHKRGPQPFNERSSSPLLALGPKLRSVVRSMIEMAGKDPDTATTAELDALDLRCGVHALLGLKLRTGELQRQRKQPL
ncbi:hypothetical protein FOMPIDRAFT_1040898 [Fomitopsis schrenkii]|uniref:F-box domain-containing protein n=1 Tax=Fomitopsis schrenkii TaxID=2126942 RepID=S8FVX7_FOMSC|nr:hypothetical protein FOMPIDRAFT_1040898 [Fomitopsis schrenkii]